MNKQEVIELLKQSNSSTGIADVRCDISVNGEVVYPNESILVIIFDDDCDDSCDDDLVLMHKHWCFCNSIAEFEEGVVYGEKAARECYCKHYVSNFISVSDFETDL